MYIKTNQPNYRWPKRVDYILGQSLKNRKCCILNCVNFAVFPVWLFSTTTTLSSNHSKDYNTVRSQNIV